MSWGTLSMVHLSYLHILFQPEANTSNNNLPTILYLLIPFVAGIVVLLNDWIASHLNNMSGGDIDINESAVNIFAAIIIYMLTRALDGSSISIYESLFLFFLSALVFYGTILLVAYVVYFGNKGGRYLLSQAFRERLFTEGKFVFAIFAIALFIFVIVGGIFVMALR